MFVLANISFLKIPEIAGGHGLTTTLLTIVFSVFLNKLVAKKIEKIRKNRIILNH